MAKTVVIHMFDDGRDGVEGIPGKIQFLTPARAAKPIQEARVEVTLSWNRAMSSCGPFFVDVGELDEGENHFDLAISNALMPLLPSSGTLPGDCIGLKPRADGKRNKDPNATVYWGLVQQNLPIL